MHLYAVCVQTVNIPYANCIEEGAGIDLTGSFIRDRGRFIGIIAPLGDVERVCPDTASSHLCIPNEKVTCKTCRVPDEARAQRYRNYGINPKEVKLSYP